MPMSLRVNRKKKELFEEAEATRPTKRARITDTPTTPTVLQPHFDAIDRSVAESLLKTSLPGRNGTYPQPIQIKGSEPLQSFAHVDVVTPARSTPGRGLKNLERAPPAIQIPALTKSTLPPSSAVPSLITDIDTSDDSLSSQNDQQHRFAGVPTPMSMMTMHGKVSTRSREHFLPKVDDTYIRSVQSRLRPDLQHRGPDRPHAGKAPSSITILLWEAAMVLNEMEGGHPLPHFEQSRNTHLGSMSSVASHQLHDALKVHALPDSLPTDPPASDVGLTSILQGIISELASGLNHGHGIPFLPPHAAHHQFMHRQRFIDGLTAVVSNAVPRVNTFINEDDAEALGAIYKSLERRLPPPELPPPTPPPGHMVVRHSFPQQTFYPTSQGPISPDSPIPLMQNIGPPLIRLAPKRRDKAAAKRMSLG